MKENLLKDSLEEKCNMKSCKNCQYCDIYNNLCFIDKQKCYKCGKLIHKECNNFHPGEWTAEDNN